VSPRAILKIEVEVMLRLTVSQPIRHGESENVLPGLDL
jgi:hypothetical protein